MTPRQIDDLMWAAQHQAWATGDDSLEALVALAEYEEAVRRHPEVAGIHASALTGRERPERAKG